VAAPVPTSPPERVRSERERPGPAAAPADSGRERVARPQAGREQAAPPERGRSAPQKTKTPKKEKDEKDNQ
jgi:hypothetical protein